MQQLSIPKEEAVSTVIGGAVVETSSNSGSLQRLRWRHSHLARSPEACLTGPQPSSAELCLHLWLVEEHRRLQVN